MVGFMEKGKKVPVTTLSTKGQTVIPKSIRDHLDLRPGDRIDFVLRENGEVLIRPATDDVRKLKGMLRRSGRKPVSLAEMNRAIRERRPRT